MRKKIPSANVSTAFEVPNRMFPHGHQNLVELFTLTHKLGSRVPLSKRSYNRKSWVSPSSMSRPRAVPGQTPGRKEPAKLYCEKFLLALFCRSLTDFPPLVLELL